eukprot:12884820-Prorocentrum_lima.AAC.1
MDPTSEDQPPTAEEGLEAPPGNQLEEKPGPTPEVWSGNTPEAQPGAQQGVVGGSIPPAALPGDAAALEEELFFFRG